MIRVPLSASTGGDIQDAVQSSRDGPDEAVEHGAQRLLLTRSGFQGHVMV
jgi:hypothetical protein